MTWDQLIELLQKVGFPIFVAGWFMFRHEKRMDRQAQLINKILLAMQMLARSVDDMYSGRPGTHGRMSTQPPFAWDEEETAINLRALPDEADTQRMPAQPAKKDEA